jgi:peptidoglycan/xylan/chitin deacetylase (PgdA/CDA1 family)
LNRAYDEGHTIGSHANGHFDGSKWSTSQWESEFQQFYNLIFNVYNQKGIEIQNYINPFHFNPDQIVGFRSPLLATNKNLYYTLKKNNFS